MFHINLIVYCVFSSYEGIFTVANLLLILSKGYFGLLSHIHCQRDIGPFGATV